MSPDVLKLNAAMMKKEFCVCLGLETAWGLCRADDRDRGEEIENILAHPRLSGNCAPLGIIWQRGNMGSLFPVSI